MYGVEILIKEHENISDFNKIVRQMCLNIINGDEPDTQDFRKAIDFVRNYADKHHHGKEEKILFEYMINNLGEIGDKLIRHGMLIEHDLGRLHMMQLEAALAEYDKSQSAESKLDIVMNATAYTDLLTRHIAKENEVAYSYAERALSTDLWSEIDEKTNIFEQQAADEGIQQHYLDMKKELEQKYM